MLRPVEDVCKSCHAKIWLYLDGELTAEELLAFQDHVNDCSSCLQQLQEEKYFQSTLRKSWTGYKAPEALRHKLQLILAAEANRSAAEIPSESEPVFPSRRSWIPIRFQINLLALQTVMAGVVALTILALFLGQYRQKEKAMAFVTMASRIHRERLQGSMPLSLESESPSQISNWVSERVPFRFRLPSYTIDSKAAMLYHLEGCRLVDFGARQAAYVAYQMEGKPISLLVISAIDAKAWGGDTTVSHELMFHSLPVDGFRVITWSAHQVTYALVSSVDLPSQQSCAVCHAAEKDRPLLKSFFRPQQVRGRDQPRSLVMGTGPSHFSADLALWQPFVAR